jgi:hypothetical protein
MLEVSNSIVTWICWQCLCSMKSVMSGWALATCGAQGVVGCAQQAKTLVNVPHGTVPLVIIRQRTKHVNTLT